MSFKILAINISTAEVREKLLAFGDPLSKFNRVSKGQPMQELYKLLSTIPPAVLFLILREFVLSQEPTNARIGVEAVLALSKKENLPSNQLRDIFSQLTDVMLKNGAIGGKIAQRILEISNLADLPIELQQKLQLCNQLDRNRAIQAKRSGTVNAHGGISGAGRASIEEIRRNEQGQKYFVYTGGNGLHEDDVSDLFYSPYLRGASFKVGIYVDSATRKVEVQYRFNSTLEREVEAINAVKKRLGWE